MKLSDAAELLDFYRINRLFKYYVKLKQTTLRTLVNRFDSLDPGSFKMSGSVALATFKIVTNLTMSTGLNGRPIFTPSVLTPGSTAGGVKKYYKIF